MNTIQYILLPDGTYAAIDRTLTWGDATILVLLVAIVFLQLYASWRRA